MGGAPPPPLPPNRAASPTAPVASPTPLSLEEYWNRLRTYRVVWGMDQLQILPPANRDDPFFGINNALKSEDATAPLMHGLGAAIDRVEVRWDEVEPRPGVFVFDQLDRLIAEAERVQLEVLVVVVGAPAWAVDRPERAGPGPPRGLDQPALRADGSPNPANPWAEFLGMVAHRYSRRVAVWEIWNEPNFRDFWRGTPADYARLFDVARAVLKAESSQATVLLGGMVVDDGAFLGDVLAHLCPNRDCGGRTIDGVAWHIYGEPTDVVRVAQLTRERLSPYGLAAPLWITEANVPVDDPQAPADALVGPEAVSLAQQAAFVSQLCALARSVDVHTVAFYRAIDVDEERHYWGLFRHDWSARPALLAYRTAARWLSHTTYLGTSHPAPGVTVVRLHRPGEDVSVLWTDRATPVRLALPASADHGTLVAVEGKETPLTPRGGSFEVTLPPAPPHRPPTAPLAPPVILVTPSNGSHP